MNKRFYAFALFLVLFCSFSFAQELPRYMTIEEQKALENYKKQIQNSKILNVTPPSSPVRTIGEWEELQGFLITWTSYQSMLKEIVRAAKQETRVYIVCSNAQTVINYLNQGPSPVDTVNVTFLVAPFNSVWCRDYGPWSAYTNDVDTLITIDWIYNRPRPLDDVIPGVIATTLGTPLYQTTTAPWDLVNTGGNFMTDGFGTAFASNLILTDNSPAGGFNVNHTAAEIDTIMNRFMGISRYIKMNTLPYDQIHHIDMHIKLIDEETLVVGQYPAGVADGPQIEANLQYILSNFNSVYGTPYKVVRIPMPADNGLYPSNGGDYFTYTNSSFINKTLIVPTYNIPSDTTALRIYRDALPGYTVTGINSTASIGALGALHCITKELGTADPLLISHQPIHDTCDTQNSFLVSALMKHRTGILSANLYYRTDTAQPYISVPMSQGFNPDYWLASIPPQVAGADVYYYVEGNSVSGKQQVRPLPAPAGYWHFKINCPVGIDQPAEQTVMELQQAFPNPSKGITCIPLVTNKVIDVSMELLDVTGKKVIDVYNGVARQGENKFFVNTAELSSGVYMIHVSSDQNEMRQMLIVK